MVDFVELSNKRTNLSVMQQELSDRQPELIKTSAETEMLMVKIEQDAVEVEAKKEVREIAGGLICFSSLQCIRKRKILRQVGYPARAFGFFASCFKRQENRNRKTRILSQKSTYFSSQQSTDMNAESLYLKC